MAPQEGSGRFRVSDLLPTNLGLDEKYIAILVEGLRDGSIRPEDLPRPYLRLKDGRYYINDGSHKIRAFLEAGIEEVEADWYSLDD